METTTQDRLENTKAQMRKGILELCVLSIINEQEAYPSDIIAQLKEHQLIVVEGTLYPLLNRLKKSGLRHYNGKEPAASENGNGRPRKYYQLTDAGEIFLAELLNTWNLLASAVYQTTKNNNQ